MSIRLTSNIMDILVSAASPDGIVNDPSDVSHPLGLVEIKNPYSARSQTLTEASKKAAFCLEHNKNDNSFRL